MRTFIFIPHSQVHAQDHFEWGYDDPVAFQKDVIDYFGEEIVSIKKEMDGYYDLGFKNGHKLYSISELCIDKREV